MFDGLSQKLTGVLGRLKGRGSLTEADVKAAMREIRINLLEADVALPVAKEFIREATERAIGESVLKSIQPGQQVVKIVNDTLIEMLGGENEELTILGSPPTVMMLVGLQGAGKTTTTAKLAKFLSEKHRQKVLMASLDVRRPAAREQLRQLGEQIDVATTTIDETQTDPVALAKDAVTQAKLEGYDIVLLDTAGRLSIDADLMDEVAAIHRETSPAETLLVADAMTGQDAVNTAQNFGEHLDLTGIVLTRIDGDARGGAALSMRHVTGKPIKFMGTGEKTDALEPFYPERIASRILDMGDIVSLVEKAADNIDAEASQNMMQRMMSGKFDLSDYLTQLRQMGKMGGLGGMMNLMPGMGKLKDAMANAQVDDGFMKRQEAIILSMTPKERKRPKLLNASRKRRIAAGSGTSVQDVNKLLKQFQQMEQMMKKLKKMGGGAGMMGGLSKLMGSMKGM